MESMEMSFNWAQEEEELSEAHPSRESTLSNLLKPGESEEAALAVYASSSGLQQTYVPG